MATARKLPSGSWRVKAYAGKDENGKNIYKSFTAATKKEAEFAAAQYAMARKESVPTRTMTLGQAIEGYITTQNNILSPSTVRGYRTIQRNAFLDIAHFRIDKLTQPIVTKSVNDYAASHGAKTVKNAYALLTASLKMYAPEMKLTTLLPKLEKHEAQIPQSDDVHRIVEAIRGTSLEIPVLLAALLGLRRSEICALTGNDIDVKNRTITISKAMVPDEHNAYIVKQPKSYAGTRTICDVSPTLMGILSPYAGKNERIVKLLPETISTEYRRLARKLNVSTRMHDLRHYNASIMLALGVPDKYAMKRLGQATPSMLKAVYQHILNDKQTTVNRAMRDAAEEIFKGNMPQNIPQET